MAEIDIPPVPARLALGNRAAKRHNIRSFADLGACFGVHAAYTRDLIENNEIEKAYVLDQFVTKLARERCAPFQQIQFVTGLLGDASVVRQVPNVDALLMYSILLHQVAPNWDDFIRLWAEKARVIIIINQNWKAGPETLRLPDQGLDWYLKWAFWTDEAATRAWFNQADQPDPLTGRKRRDLHQFWQWGITTEDLILHLRSIGFRLDYFENYGYFNQRVPWFHNEGMIFVRENSYGG
jgi:hypothetical protein